MAFPAQPKSRRGTSFLVHHRILSVPFALLQITVNLISFGCDHTTPNSASLDAPPIILAPIAYANVIDGRGRFREIYCALRNNHGRGLPDDLPCEKALARLSGEPEPSGKTVFMSGPTRPIRVVVIPGIFGECVIEKVSPYSDALAHLNTHGYKTGLIPVSGRSSSAYNAWQIRDAIMGMSPDPGERLVLVGYSKGTPDALVALATYSEIVPRVAALVSVAGAVHGTPLADAGPHLLDDLLEKLMRTVDIKACHPRDGGGVESLRRDVRIRFMAGAVLPRAVGYYSLVGLPGPTRVSRILRSGYESLAKIESRNDSQVIFYDAIIPGATLLGFAQADHWAIAMPFTRQGDPLLAQLLDHNAFPREILLEAVIRTVEESLEPAAE